MTLAGSNLSDLRKSHKDKCFSNWCGVQMLEAIETVHMNGLLHRDIKPANFAIGREGAEVRILYILDFGLVRKHILKHNKVRPARSTAAFRGSVRYASINSHHRKDLGRVDDLWSWLYSLIELKKCHLPWSQESSMRKTCEMKESTSCEVLMESMEEEYVVIYKSLQTLVYESCPMYKMYNEEFAKLITRKHYDMKSPLDWEEGGENYQHSNYKIGPFQLDEGEKVVVDEKSKKDEHT